MGGGDKCLLDLGGRPVLAWLLDRLGAQARPIALNANGEVARFAAFGIGVLADPIPGLPGPLAGILAGLLWARALGAQRLLTVAGDTPFLPLDLSARLAERGAPEVIVMAASGGRLHPTIALWPTSLVALLEDWMSIENNFSVRQFVMRNSWSSCSFGEQIDPFFNINTRRILGLLGKGCIECWR